MATTKKVTSFVHHVTGAGSRISYTYSEIDENGKIVADNVKDSLVVVDETVQVAVDTVNEYLNGILNQ